MTRSLKTFLSFLVIFSLHRVFADSNLRITILSSGQDAVLQRLVGVLSDAWIAALFTFPVWLISFSSKNKFSKLCALWIAFWAGLTAGHQGYVDFFKQQIIPFHLSYLVDPSFVQANGPSFFETKSLAIFTSGLLLSIWSAISLKPKSGFKETKAFLFILIFGILCHVLNIRYRVQWFVPEMLQTHYLEHLVSSLKTKPMTLEISSEDLRRLRAVSKVSESATLREHLTPQNAPLSKEVIALEKAIAAIKQNGRTPLVILVAAESFRPADSGWTRDDSDPISLTPTFDKLTQSGTHFTQAYSTGPVTRGGQEALWCGVPTGTDSSLMRSYPQYRTSCVSDLSRAQRNISVWIHGGDPRFDSQESFWTRHGVDKFILQSDFGDNISKTGWGISDLAILEKSLATLKVTSDEQKGLVVLAFILTVTNHIPWQLPSDTPDNIKSLEADHPSERTTAYFDYALGKFVQGLRAQNLWQDSVLVISSDHGNLEQPRNKSYKKGEDDKYEQLSSHINLLLSGGAVEDLVSKGILNRVVETWTSQAQVAPFIAKISGHPADGFMDAPLFSKSPWPVASDLNQYLYLPKSRQRLSKEAVLETVLDPSDEESMIAATRLRGFLQLLNESSEHAK